MSRHLSPSAPAEDLGSVPLDEAPVRRTRLRRGGPRTPLPLLPLIAAIAGVGVAYVGQSAHVTQATYQATALVQQNQQLRVQAEQLADNLGRVQSAERIVAAAQKLGMRPAAHWTYINTGLTPVVGLPVPQLTGGQPPEDALQQLVASLGGLFGLGDHQAGSP